MKVEISKRAEKDLAKLETDIRNRIIIELLLHLFTKKTKPGTRAYIFVDELQS